MAAVQDLIVDVDTGTSEAAVQSIRSLFAAVDAAQSLDEGLPNGLVLPDDVVDLIAGEPIDGTADRARELQTIKFDPSDRHLELVSAVAAHRNAYSIRVAHGWPILVAKADDAASAGPESIA